ncbi:MAG: YggS family pyridoxal phosphate-dependent enzyme [Flavobacteriales bacterium]|nr:YggS family pyridoxal phosphate-dependent enzyme [Flavobacteriales bacterium]
MSIADNLIQIQSQLKEEVELVAVSKTKPSAAIQEAYDAGQRIFGENRPQEMQAKAAELPKDIQWHMIGHLQSNKVKYIAAFVSLIHSVDKLSLLHEINKRATQHNRVIPVLLQVYIAQEESKFGMDEAEINEMLTSEEFRALQNVQVVGLMGMATNTDNKSTVQKEFASLKQLFNVLKTTHFKNHSSFKEISMGMSGDFLIAIKEGSTLVRVGSAIFGGRN